MDVDPDMPVDPDLEELPEKLRHHEGPLTITGTDEDGNVWEAQVMPKDVASALADARRLRAAD